jgi:thymidylate kinase
MSNAVSIHLEGMDLAGKTTACRCIPQTLGGEWQVRHNCLWADNPVYALADRLRREGGLAGDALGHLYVAALAADLASYVAPALNTVQDSTILLRSLAYHTVARTPNVVAALTALIPRHPRFDRTIVLTASREARLRRLERRRREQPDAVGAEDLLVVQAPARFFAMEQVLVRFAREHFAAMVINTSGMDEAEVVRAVAAAVAVY